MTRIAAAVGLLAASAFAASQPAPPSPIETRHLTIAVTSPARAVVPGARLSLRLDITPKTNMHVYAPQQPDSIPVSLTLDRSRDYVAHPASFPAPEKFLFKPLNETQLVYSKPFRIVQDVTIARTPEVRRLAQAADAVMTIKGNLRYQACDDVVCYAPKTVPLTWTVGLKMR
jgi:DsbC/DsbD-like thiol-disulfide interchange protein